MTYVISDLHGLELAKLQALLGKVNFSDNDFLYILGDVIDRQNDGGVDILEWLLTQYNVQLILGNHEAMLLSCAFVFDEITDETISEMTNEKVSLLQNYMLNGGDVTLESLQKLSKKRPETVADILDYLNDCPLYEAVTINDKDFLLVHAGLDNFRKNKKMSEYTADDLLWCEPELADNYFDDITTVFGHTPTMCFGDEYKGEFIKTKTWIDIDVGIPYGETPKLLCLDNMAETIL